MSYFLFVAVLAALLLVIQIIKELVAKLGSRPRADSRSKTKERMACEERLLQPDWEFYETHLGRPVPTALRELYGDRNLIAASDLPIPGDAVVARFQPLDSDALVDSVPVLNCDFLPIATTTSGDQVLLRPGKSAGDVVYLLAHETGELIPVAPSVDSLLRHIRSSTKAR